MSNWIVVLVSSLSVGGSVGPAQAVVTVDAPPVVAPAHYVTRSAWSRREIQDLVVREAQRNGVVPPALALAVARVESNFDADALSHAGAIGVMQIMPATAWGEFRVAADELWDPRVNVRLGIEFLALLYERYGRWDAALSHYNGGSLRGHPSVARPHDYTRAYVASVRDWEHHFGAELPSSADADARLAAADAGFSDETVLAARLAEQRRQARGDIATTAWTGEGSSALAARFRRSLEADTQGRMRHHSGRFH